MTREHYHDRPRCAECNCLAPAHYGSCSKVAVLEGKPAFDEAEFKRKANMSNANLVRTTLMQLDKSLDHSREVSFALRTLRVRASDELLAKLRRMLK